MFTVVIMKSFGNIQGLDNRNFDLGSYGRAFFSIETIKVGLMEENILGCIVKISSRKKVSLFESRINFTWNSMDPTSNYCLYDLSMILVRDR